MDLALKQKFADLWNTRFAGAELPIVFYYTDDTTGVARVEPPAGRQCLIGVLTRVRNGESLCFDADSVGCSGGKRYLGFSDQLRPNFEYFLSCGIPGEMEGERYKKTPDLVRELMRFMPKFKAPAKHIVFKRWDALESADEPAVAIFFATPDVLSGLFTLANFDQAQPYGVFAPFAAGCGTIIQYPYLEQQAEAPRAVLGMFDVSARPYVPAQTLSFAVPMKKLRAMIENMEESFLITKSWNAVRARIGRE